MIRLYVLHDLQAEAVFDLSAEHSHYLAHVMRQHAGGVIALFNGRHGVWTARIEAVQKKTVQVRLMTCTRPQPPAPQLQLWLALIKRSRLEWAVEKATELGVGRIQLLTTRYTQNDHVRLERLQTIAVEAAEQCGRAEVPEIATPQPLMTALTAWSDGNLVYCDEALAGVDVPFTPTHVRGILIGPEGGFSDDERAHLRGLPFVRPISLGPRILRADTAAVAALVRVGQT